MGLWRDFPPPSTSRVAKNVAARTSGHRSVEHVRLQPFGKSWACDSRCDGRGWWWMDGGWWRVYGGCFLPPRTLWGFLLFTQIAIAIGVLTSNRRGGRRTTLADWTWCQGAIAGVVALGAIAGCYSSVLWLGGG